MYWNSALLMASLSALGGSNSRLMVMYLSVCFLISVLSLFLQSECDLSSTPPQKLQSGSAPL